MNRLHRWYCRSGHWQRTLERLIPWALEGLELGDHVLELGPGPGLVTPALLERAARVTTIDPDAWALSRRRVRAGGRLAAVRGDAAALPFPAGTFSAVVAFTMLHHLDSPARQDLAFGEARRTLGAGGCLVGLEPRDGLVLRLFHLGSTFVPVPPDTVEARLSAAGFTQALVRQGREYVAFVARVPGSEAVGDPRPAGPRR